MRAIVESPMMDVAPFRGYLLWLASQLWDPRLQGRQDPSDLVQQTLCEAFENLADFRGRSDRELAGWLRTILARKIVNARRQVLGRRGDRARQVRLVQRELEELSSRFESLAAEQSSPSERVIRDEQMRRLADALDALPADQKRAVTLKYLAGGGKSLADVAALMDRSEPAVAGLLRRALKRLREQLKAGG